MLWVPFRAWVGWVARGASVRAWSRRELWSRRDAQGGARGAASARRDARAGWSRRAARATHEAPAPRRGHWRGWSRRASWPRRAVGHQRQRPAPGGIEGGGFAPFLSCRYQPKKRLRSSVLVFGETPLSPLLENCGFLPVQIFGPFAEKPNLIGQGRTPESIVWKM